MRALAVIGGRIVHITFEEFALRLGQAVHTEYRSFVLRKGERALHSTLADPAEICALNLREKALNEAGPTAAGFVLWGKDGDFYVISHESDAGVTRLWSHETREFSGPPLRTEEVLEKLAAMPVGGLSANQEGHTLTRADRPSLAALIPVTPQDLKAVAAENADFHYFERLEGVNPFTKEMVYLGVMGLALASPEGEGARLDLVAGALVTRNCLEGDLTKVKSVLERLSCHVFPPIGKDDDS
jgi:hypothetical protein